MPYLFMRDGLPLYYEEQGSGSPIVLVPGWTITTRFWARQLADLARDHRVVTLDLRGAGNSGKTPDGHSLASYAEDLRQLLEQLKLDNVTLVAWAMGVSVSAHYLVTRAGRRAARFVWVDHSPRFFTAQDWPFALFGDFSPQALDATIHRLAHDRAATTRELLASMFAAPLTPTDADWMYAEMLKTPTEVATAMLATVANVDLRSLVPQLDLPVLLVNGRKSIVPFDVAEWLQEHLPDARRVIFERAGHAPFWEEAEAFNQAVREFARSEILRT